MTTLTSFDPRTSEPFGEPIAQTDAEAVDAIARRAQQAAAAWAATADADRAAAIDAVAAALDDATEALVAIADRETALGDVRLRGEVARTSGQLRMFADIARDGNYSDPIISPAAPAIARPDIRRMLVPMGPVAVFGASNFPFAFSVAGGDTASALAIGCPVVAKAHEGHPATSRLVAEIVTGALAAAGAPDGVFGMVYGPEAGRTLVQHPAIKAVGFTGSTAGGRYLFDLASGRSDPIPFYGELGSMNPVVVLPSAAAARADEIATGYAGSLTQGVGQFCTNPGLMFVPSDSPELLTAIGTAVAATRGGPMLTGRVHDAYQSGVTEPVWTGLDLVGASDLDGDGPWSATPQVRRVELTDFAGDLERLDIERFGPAGLVVTYRDVADLLPVLARLEGSLTATIQADLDSAADVAAAGEVASALAGRAGRLIMNGWPTGVAVCWAMHHGGPWPASTAAGHTSVGATAVRRWLVPVAYQSWPDDLLPPPLQAGNPRGLRQLIQP
jgi:NADP-dependent aldehyde dehydrogenase